jgi:hypothetical protein
VSRSNRSLLVSAIVVAAALVAHFVMIRVFAEANVVSSLFACGEHVPPSTAALAVAFMVARLFTVMLLPGVILSAIGAWAVERWAESRNTEGTKLAPPGPSEDARTD